MVDILQDYHWKFFLGSGFFGVKLLIILQTSLTEVNILLRFCSVRHGQIRRVLPVSSNVDFEAKLEAKIFTLSVKEDTTSGPFIIMGTATFLC